MWRERTRIPLGVAATVAVVLSGCLAGGTSPAPRATAAATPTASLASSAGSFSVEPSATADTGLAPTGPTQEALVTRVVDGDTIVVAMGGMQYKVRYIGVDTPESVKPGTAVQLMGPEASAANKRLVEGKEVVLEKDVSETDRYGRLLRYVWLRQADGGWQMVNLELLRLGFAQVSTFPPDVKYVDSLFLPAQEAARAASVGLWADDLPALPSGSPSSLSPLTCDPAYPSVCIAPPPPDLDCRDIPYRRFTVLPPDPHRFDGDHDGIGCES